MGHFGVNKGSQNLKVVLLEISNPESGTFWASVSGQKGIFGVNLVSQILKVALLNFSNPESGTF